MRQATMTTAVPLISCCWFGHSTFFSSAHDSPKKRKPGTPGRRPERRGAGGLRAALAALLPRRAGH